MTDEGQRSSEAVIAYYAAVLEQLKRYVCDAHPISFVTDAADGRTTISLVLDSAALRPYMARLDGAAESSLGKAI